MIVGSRATLLKGIKIKSLNLTQVLVMILYILAAVFVISAAIVESGLGLSSRSVCHTAIMICLSFYVSSKVTM